MVTVLRDDGREDRWAANGIDVEDGALVVGTGKDGIEDVVAVYPKDYWRRASDDARRLPGEAPAVEALVLRDVENALSQSGTYEDRVHAAGRRLSDWRETGR